MTATQAVNALRAHGVVAWEDCGEVFAAVHWTRRTDDPLIVERGVDVERVPCTLAGVAEWLGY